MCFSANVSFITGTLLLGTGSYSVTRAFHNNKKYLFFSLIPILFGLQQIVEGFVWLSLAKNMDELIQNRSLMYLFIAHLWSFYIPFSLYFIEGNTKKRMFLALFAFSGFILFSIIYIPLFLLETKLNVSVMNDSIRYTTNVITPLKIMYASLYLFISIIPFFISSIKDIKILGVLYAFSVLFSYLWFSYAFSSIWCFFAAILSIYIAFIIYKTGGNL